MSGFTTATPPNAAFVPRQLLRALLTATRKPVAAAEGCDRARSGRKMGRLGVSGFTTAARHAHSDTLTCSRCRRLRSSAKRSQDGTPRCVRFYDGFAAERSLRSSSAATRLAHSHTLTCSSCRRLRSSAKRPQNGTPRCVRFYDGCAADRSLRSSSAAFCTPATINPTEVQGL